MAILRPTRGCQRPSNAKSKTVRAGVIIMVSLYISYSKQNNRTNTHTQSRTLIWIIAPSFILSDMCRIVWLKRQAQTLMAVAPHWHQPAFAGVGAGSALSAFAWWLLSEASRPLPSPPSLEPAVFHESSAEHPRIPGVGDDLHRLVLAFQALPFDYLLCFTLGLVSLVLLDLFALCRSFLVHHQRSQSTARRRAPLFAVDVTS